MLAGSGPFVPFDFLSIEGRSELDGLLAAIAEAALCDRASVCAFVAAALLASKAMTIPPPMAHRLIIERP
jgi:hypothetical protein